jgi:hypothetical protein
MHEAFGGDQALRGLRSRDQEQDQESDIQITQEYEADRVVHCQLNNWLLEQYLSNGYPVPLWSMATSSSA